ncbi:hypothetical protein [Bowmanella denitrificans]|uniref:hypothetical protein n=1 Tax=Bowmanella denitrificans TaxID=366582 RepID=UPI000C9BE8D5|nr:hypothetical protein [Bowmanella denitrificans]
MIRLSRQGWNNVLIFATLLLIILFNQSGKFLSDAPDSESNLLLPADIPVMKMEFGHHQLERIGQGWRLRPATDATEAQLQQLVNQWQSASMQALGPGRLESPIVVVVWLAGESQGRVYSIQQSADGLLVAQQGQLYQLPGADLSDFIPAGVY